VCPLEPGQAEPEDGDKLEQGVEGEEVGEGVDDAEEEEEVGDPLVVGGFFAAVDCADGGEEWEDVGERQED